MIKSLEIGKAINALVKDILPVYPIIADHGATFPFAIYQRTSLTPHNSKDIRNYVEVATVEIVVCSLDYEESLRLAVQIKERLQHKRGHYEGIVIDNIDVIDSSEDWVNDTYLQSLTLQIFIM